MSQFFVNTSAGPIPPAIPTQFTADDATIGIPVANNFNLLSRETTVNNDNGIQTTTDLNGSANHYTELTNRFTLTTSTVGAVTSTVTGLSSLIPGTYVLDIKIAAYATAGGPDGNGYTIVGGVISDGVTATLLPNQAKDSFENTVGANAVLGVSGNTITVTVTGVVGITFNWKVTGTYILVS